jgi:polysaccharide deacetylase family protein (PEP-CTERM system associated)
VTPPPDILTVDVEEWFHGHNYLRTVPRERWDEQESRVVPNTERCLEILARHDVRATFFVLGWTAERHPDLVRRIAAAGHEVACHSYAHPIVFELGPEEFAADLDRCLSALATGGVREVAGYRAPSFTMTPPVHGYLELLRARRFRYDCSLFPISHPRYGQSASPRRPFLLEGVPGASPFAVVPMTVARLGVANFPFSGGGYLRVLPLAAYWALRSVARRQGVPTILYVHPWELDSFRPDAGLSRLMRWRAQGGQLTMPGKLESILGEGAGSFQTMGEYVARLVANGTLPRRSLPL